MDSEQFKNLYSMQATDESITPFIGGVGFSLIRKYPEGTDYYRDDRRMFVKIGISNRLFFYSVDMTKPQKREEKTDYVITDGNEYKKRTTNFFSDGDEFDFNNESKKIIYKLTKKELSMNEFVEVLVKTHLSDVLFFRRIRNEFFNLILKFLFWLSDDRYDRIETAINKYHRGGGEAKSEEKKKNIEPFFKYFYISKNILFFTLIITFLIPFLFGCFWLYGEFSLSNPLLILLFFLILFICEKLSVWLDKKIKEFVMPQNNVFTEPKKNFLEKLHDYQYQNKFKIKL